MCKRLLPFVLVLALIGTPSASALIITDDIGPVFEATADFGNPKGIGSTMYQGADWYGDVLVDKYFMTAGGTDIWGNSDQGHFAYKTVTGDMRLSVGYTWQAPRNDWTKAGPMFRVSLDGDSVQYFCTSKKNHDRACFQFRSSKGGSSTSEEYLKSAAAGSPAKPVWLGIQRVTIEGIPFLEGMVDWGKGKGWERVGNLKMALHLPNEIMLGVAMTSHETDGTAQAWVYDPWYEKNPKLVGPAPTFSVVPATGAIVFDPTGKTSGFKIRAIKAQFGQIDSYTVMNQILDFGCTGPMCIAPGMPIPGAEAGERVEQFVNVRDTGDGAFGNNQSYPGIDPLEQPAPDPAGGDDDNDFAVEITGVIKLTAGTHIIGVNSDDGAQIDIGGLKLETVALKGNSNEDFIIKAEADGFYPLKVRHMERGGGSSIELHEVLLPSGTRILLNDVAAGGSAVYAP